MKMNRLDLLKTVGLASGAMLAGGACRSGNYAGNSMFAHGTLQPLPSPENSGIEHIVVVTMENRSFDHFLGWLPNADGKQAGLTYVDSSGASHPTHTLAPDWTGCGSHDPDHSYAGGRVEVNNGLMDGFLKTPGADTYAVGYYRE